MILHKAGPLLWSGRPGSNRPPSAWKADALPNELLPLNFISDFGLLISDFPLSYLFIHIPFFLFVLIRNHKSQIRNPKVGREGFEPSKSKQQIYSLSHLATLVSPLLFQQKKEPMEGFEPPTS
jgi:hypothetical protein